MVFRHFQSQKYLALLIISLLLLLPIQIARAVCPLWCSSLKNTNMKWCMALALGCELLNVYKQWISLGLVLWVLSYIYITHTHHHHIAYRFCYHRHFSLGKPISFFFFHFSSISKTVMYIYILCWLIKFRTL